MTDDVAELGTDWLRPGHEDRTVETVAIVGVVHTVLDVHPLEVAHVGLWLEARSGTLGADRTGNHEAEHRWQEHKAVRERGLAICVGDLSLLAPLIGINLAVWLDFDPSTTGEVPATWEVVDGVVETPEARVNTKGLEQVGDTLGIPKSCRAVVFFVANGVRSLHVRDKDELRATVLHTKGATVHLCGITDEFHIDFVQDALGEQARRNDVRHASRSFWKTRCSDDLVFRNVSELDHSATLPCVANHVGEVLIHEADLLLGLESVASVVDADVFGLQGFLGERVRADGLTGWHDVSGRDAVVAVSIVGGETIPSINVVGEVALHGQHLNGVGKTVRPCFLGDEFVPNRSVERLLVDFWTDAACLADEDVI